MYRLPVAFVSIFMVLSLTACKPAPPAETVPVAKKQIEDAPKPSKKKLISIEEIDFSKYPGATKPAAFGFYFGLSQDQIEKAGMDSEVMSRDGFVVVKTELAPLPWADAESYYLHFFENKLVKVVAAGKNITGDAAGTEGKEKYKSLQMALTEKYGKTSDSFHRIGTRVYKERDEFYECLAYDGCGVWLDFWDDSEKSINLSLEGTRTRGVGFIGIAYDAKPELELAINAIKSKKEKATQKGL